MTVRVPAELTESDPALLAPAAGLVHLPDDQPGIERLGGAGAWQYRDADGGLAQPDRVAQIVALAIPPAWIGVWICPDSSGYLQASGYDAAGRKQYRYHDAYREFAEAQKFRRLAYFGRAVPLIRAAIDDALQLPLGSREHAVAAAVRLVDDHLLRVGNHRSAAHGHYGATTLTVDHLVGDTPEDGVVLDYVGKSGASRNVIVEDDLADVLTMLADDADDELFWFDDGSAAQRRRATAQDLNEFIAEHAGSAFTARDFRTWGGSAIALATRARGERLLDAVDAAADELGNTRAVARSSYVHPAVIDADDAQVAGAWKRSRSSRWFDRSESALRKIIADR